MTQDLLQIKHPTLPARWSKQQMEAGAVRIHQRFQGLLLSVIESADWANYRISSDPIEAGRPAWPDPGKYCDIVLARRSGHVEVALEIKTRHAGISENPTDVMHKVLDQMGTSLLDLQRAAHEADALWCVAVGVYRVNFQAMAISHAADWSDIVLVWGRDIGRDSPMGSMRWASFDSLDASMCSYTEPSKFFEVFSLPRKPAPVVEIKPQAPRSVLDDLVELSSWVDVRPSMQAAIKMLAEWPLGARLPLRTLARNYTTDEVSEYAIQHQVLNLIDAGVVRGYRKGKKSHALSLDLDRLRDYLGEA